MQKKSARVIAIIGALIGWFAIIVQLYLMLENRVVPIPQSLLRFFGFFTIDTNILVAICLTFIGLRNKNSLGKFFSKSTTITALTVYITIVGLVYNVILRSTWDPQGLQKLVDELLHSVIPILFIIFWFIFVPIENIKWKNVFPWLIYPIVYMIYALVHGAIINWYPYPFVDVNKLGYNTALINAFVVLGIIFLLSLALIGISKLMRKFNVEGNKVVS